MFSVMRRNFDALSLILITVHLDMDITGIGSRYLTGSRHSWLVE